jgi:hypothetical protein
MAQEILHFNCTVNYVTKKVQELSELHLPGTIMVQIQNNKEFSIRANNNVKSGMPLP